MSETSDEPSIAPPPPPPPEVAAVTARFTERVLEEPAEFAQLSE